MAVRLAVASGKGGTGKTSVSVNLNHFLSLDGKETILVDCDVEEPNDHLFFPEISAINSKEVHQEIPVIDTSRCTFCRKCAEYCEFNAILVIPPVKFAEVNPALCHSCGACTIACENDAIWVREEPIGKITNYDTGIGTGIQEGRLNVGSAMQTMLIRDLKKSLPPNKDFLILDAPPGTSCPVVETISDTDFAILVTEPTPFGLHDLKLIVDVVRELDIPFGVVINKAGLGNDEVYDYLEKEKILLLGEIPFDRSYAFSYAEGNLLSNIPANVRKAYIHIIENVEQNLVR